MPKVKNPLMSMEARGGIGGLVYNTWRGINYVKTNTSPTGQGSALRLAAQALLIAISKLWQTLSSTTRSDWAQYAVDHPVSDWTGSPKRLTGMNWYVRCNVLLQKCGLATVSAAPTIPAPSALTGMTGTYSTNAIRLSWSTPSDSTLGVMSFVTPSQSKGITGKLEQASYASYCSSAVAQPFAITGTVASGRVTIFAKVVDRTTGLPSSVVSTTVDVP